MNLYTLHRNGLSSGQRPGDVAAVTREHGVDDTVLSFAYTSLKAYEARRSVP